MCFLQKLCLFLNYFSEATFLFVQHATFLRPLNMLHSWENYSSRRSCYTLVWKSSLPRFCFIKIRESNFFNIQKSKPFGDYAQYNEYFQKYLRPQSVISSRPHNHCTKYIQNNDHRELLSFALTAINLLNMLTAAAFEGKIQQFSVIVVIIEC